jgi:hypothetical protein
VIVVWMVIGIALLAYFRMRSPERIEQTAALYISGEDESADQQPTAQPAPGPA